jgi:hypothetical protein
MRTTTAPRMAPVSSQTPRSALNTVRSSAPKRTPSAKIAHLQPLPFQVSTPRW